MTVAEPRLFGCRTMTGRLRRVFVRAPRIGDCPQWKALGWRAQPDPARLAAEHEAFAETLREAGADVVVADLADLLDPILGD